MLLRVVALGGLLAGGAWIVLGPPGGQDADASRIVVTGAHVAHQQAYLLRQWNRPPTATELRRAVDAYVREEVLYREALVKGMDRLDPRVRMALVQKMEMLAAGRADAQEISDADLGAFYALRKERYRVPAQLSFVQVFFKEESGEERAGAVVDQFGRQAPSSEQVEAAGDMTMLGAVHQDLSTTEIQKRFGPQFSAAVLELPVDRWSGPLRSPFGFHVVKVTEHIPARIPALDDVRERVMMDVRYEAGQSALEQGFLEIAGKYQVRMTEDAQRLLEGSAP